MLLVISETVTLLVDSESVPISSAYSDTELQNILQTGSEIKFVPSGARGIITHSL